MTISPEQIKRPDYLKNEARFANGLHTVGGIEGGKSIICNIDNVQADLKTLREIQEEYKFSPDGYIRMNYHQLENFKTAQVKAVLKHFALIGWYAENPETVIHDSNDTIWVLDLGNLLNDVRKDTIRSVYPYGLKLSLDSELFTKTTRQAWNKHTWDLTTKPEFDFETLHLEKLESKFDWQSWTAKFYGINA